MTIIVIVVLFLIFKAHREKRPLKVVLTPEEARDVRARWWAAAKSELKCWVICFGIGMALLGEDLANAHWKTMTYVAIVWASLILFSRLALWLTLACAVVALLIQTAGIHPWPAIAPFFMVSACVYAIVARAILFLFMACRPAKPIDQPRRTTRVLENRNF